MMDEKELVLADIVRDIGRVEEKVDQLLQLVTGILGGIAQAQSSGGMMGMMAKQLPDASAILNDIH